MGAPFVWFDLTLPEGGQVADFYHGLFGWNTGPGAGDYQDWLIESGQPWAGTVAGGEVPAGRWVPYVAVADFDGAVKKALDLGGMVIQDKTTGPAGTSVTVSDPGGTLIALFTPAAG